LIGTGRRFFVAIPFLASSTLTTVMAPSRVVLVLNLTMSMAMIAGAPLASSVIGPRGVSSAGPSITRPPTAAATD
jgi:hypothetical protein